MAIVKNKIVDPKRILVIKFSSIGDIVLTTSPLKSLKNIFPNSKIDILTLNVFSPLLEGNQYINKIIPFDRNAGFSDLVRFGRLINKSNYELVIDFHNSLRSKIIRLIIRNIAKRHLRKPRWKRFLLFRFRKNYFSKDFNQLQLLHQPIKEWMNVNNYPTPELYVSDNEKDQAKLLLNKAGIGNSFIVLIPGAAWPQKTWLTNYYNDLVKQLKKQNELNFVILGGKDDNICTEIALSDLNLVNLQGKTSLRESMAIISNSKFVIGADTGLVHAAEALGKRVITIMGPTARETGAGVNREDSINIENKDVWCRPCSQSGNRKCYRNEQYCMTTLTPQFVYEEILKGGLI